MGCVCVYARRREREVGASLESPQSSGCEKSAFSGKRLKKARADFLPALGPSREEFAHCRPTTTRHSVLLSFLIFATFMCLSKLIRTCKNWHLAWTRLISLPLIAPKEFKSISWLWADLCSCSRFPTLCHRRGAHPYQARTRGARVSAAFWGVWQNSRWRSRTKHLKVVLASSAVFKQHFGLWTRLVRTIFFLFSVSEESLHLCFPLFLPMWARVSPELQQQQE